MNEKNVSISRYCRLSRLYISDQRYLLGWSNSLRFQFFVKIIISLRVKGMARRNRIIKSCIDDFLLSVKDTNHFLTRRNVMYYVCNNTINRR